MKTLEENSQSPNNETILDANELIAQRRAKLEQLRQQGVAFPNRYRRDSLAGELHQAYDSLDHDGLAAKAVKVKVAGRIMMRRLMGKACFFALQDMTGRMQAYLTLNDLGADAYEQIKHWDLGDIIGVEGELFKTKTNELTVRASGVHLLTKALRPLPDKFHGLSNQEVRYRQRYLDLIANEESRQVFHMRTKIIQGIREFLNARQFLEVETPMMQSLAGGAAAKPFKTFHNALGMELFLRIAPELYLKRLVVGGFEKVYEINRNFRNEGLSTRHNPEFTMLEFYQAYADYHDLINLTEELMRHLAKSVLGTTQLEYQGTAIDLAQPFKRISLAESLLAYNAHLSQEILNDKTKLTKFAEGLGVEVKPSYGLGKIQFEIFEKTVEHALLQPTFITEYPTEVSPLARCNDDNPEITDRFEFFVGGREMANGFSELNDPEDQAERLLNQVKQKEAGDQEAMNYDEDYITALEHGLPPTAGEGIGIDRLVMFFTNSPSIRDVILFPQLRD